MASLRTNRVHFGLCAPQMPVPRILLVYKVFFSDFSKLMHRVRRFVFVLCDLPNLWYFPEIFLPFFVRHIGISFFFCSIKWRRNFTILQRYLYIWRVSVLLCVWKERYSARQLCVFLLRFPFSFINTISSILFSATIDILCVFCIVFQGRKRM